MESMVGRVVKAACDYDRGDVRRINHLLKVFALAQTIAACENLEPKTRRVLEMAAALHDIGIHCAEARYQSSSGAYQQIEGPPIAREILEGLGCAEEEIARVCFLIAHHHTYHLDAGADYQILLEADFIVNFSEEGLAPSAAQHAMDSWFQTESGRALLRDLLREREEE